MTTTTDTTAQAQARADVDGIGEADAIAILLTHLPDASLHELLQLGRSCPDPWVVDATDRLTIALADLRSHLTVVVTEAHQGAVAAEQWIASLDREPVTVPTSRVRDRPTVGRVPRGARPDTTKPRSANPTKNVAPGPSTEEFHHATTDAHRPSRGLGQAVDPGQHLHLLRCADQRQHRLPTAHHPGMQAQRRCPLMAGRKLIRCDCSTHRGKACQVAEGGTFAEAATTGDARRAQQNRHNLLLLSEHGQATTEGPWPVGDRDGGRR
uniref:hypothetical protein n=1 Tax=Sphaerisporangium sp. CA-236357 TaxID=3240030 RepID=UPI003F490F53